MSRYFFHVFDSEVIMDEEGIDLPDPDAAWHRGVHEARFLAAHTITTEGRLILDDRIEIVNESGATVWRIELADAIKVGKRADV